MAGKILIKLEEEAISVILVADTVSESGAKATNVRKLFEEEEEQNNNSSQPQQK
jgi:hypothetical protein